MKVKDWQLEIRALVERQKPSLQAAWRSARGVARWYVAGPLLVVVWVLSGLFAVAPDEEAVVVRFGRYVRTAQPGVHYRLPWPVERLERSRIRHLHRFEIGFRTGEGTADAVPVHRTVAEESRMLTGDENLVDLEFVVQATVADSNAYLFNVADVEATVRGAAEAVMRQVVGSMSLDAVLTAGRADIQSAVKAALQAVLDSYAAGLNVAAVQLLDVQPPETVRPAFEAVVSAHEESGRLVNEARGYADSLSHRGEGEAARVIQAAEAYKARTVLEAQGDAARFTARLEAYRQAKEVTRQRYYLDTLQEILGRARKVVVDGRTAGVLPLLPLTEAMPGLGSAPTAQEKK